MVINHSSENAVNPECERYINGMGVATCLIWDIGSYNAMFSCHKSEKCCTD